MTEDMRERVRKEPVTLRQEELERTIAMLEILSDPLRRCLSGGGTATHIKPFSTFPALRFIVGKWDNAVRFVPSQD